MSDISTFLSTLVKIFTMYFSLSLVFAVGALPIFRRLRRRRAVRKECTPRTKFAVVIAARNEENVIAQLIDSLHKQDYPSELFDIIAVPNNCTDDTETAALTAGAKIMHPSVTVRNKGDVLHDILGRLTRESDYDAFVLFDADNVVDPAFLREIDKSMQGGALACKGRQLAKNPYESATAGCYAIWFEFSGWLFNTSRSVVKMSAKVVGTGFAVHRDLLLHFGGWNTTSICEDTEFGAKCSLEGVRVHWVPTAITYDEQPNSFAVSIRQRRRWASGVMHTGSMYIGRLFANVVHGRASLLSFDMFMALVAPFAQAFAVIPITMSFLQHVMNGSPERILLQLATTYAGIVAGTLALMFIRGYRNRGMVKGCLLFPIYMLTWFPLNVISVFKRTTRWTAIVHVGGKQPQLSVKK
jgi:cellulose synthase/poly-beta-1,6-N-acetylglucosamine synthase-like glycosyltransferase